MMKIKFNLKTSFWFTLILFFLISCKKQENKINPIKTINNSTLAFNWTENGGANNTADSARFSAQYKTLFAWKGTKKFEINLNADTVATYSIGNGNAFAFVSSGLHSANAGNIIVSSNNVSLISGSFDVNMNTGGFTTIKGTFTDINIK